MKPGRELDALIAEKVMGVPVTKTVRKRPLKKDITIYTEGEPSYYDEQGALVLRNAIPNYSTDIAAAWEVVEKLNKDGWIVKLITSELAGSDCVLTCTSDARGRFHSDLMEGRVMTAPEAICIAALKAVK